MENNSIKKKRHLGVIWIIIAIVVVVVLSHPLSQIISRQIAFKCADSTKEYCDTHFFINIGVVYVMKYSNKNDIPIPQDLKQVAPSRGYVVYSGTQLTNSASVFSTYPTGAIWFFRSNGSLFARCDYNDHKNSFSKLEEYVNAYNEFDFLYDETLMKSNRWYRAVQNYYG